MVPIQLTSYNGMSFGWVLNTAYLANAIGCFLPRQTSERSKHIVRTQAIAAVSMLFKAVRRTKDGRYS